MTIVAADELRLLIERIERLEEEKKAISDDVRDVYAEGKARGYCAKTMRAVVKLRKMEPHDRQEAEALLDTYKVALGMESYDNTPLGRAAANDGDEAQKAG
jgi:uncharacterized protein (UPF0335 family)